MFMKITSFTQLPWHEPPLNYKKFDITKLAFYLKKKKIGLLNCQFFGFILPNCSETQCHKADFFATIVSNNNICLCISCCHQESHIMKKFSHSFHLLQIFSLKDDDLLCYAMKDNLDVNNLCYDYSNFYCCSTRFLVTQASYNGLNMRFYI